MLHLSNLLLFNIFINITIVFIVFIFLREWLSIIPSSRHWDIIRDEVVEALKNACLVETEPAYVTCYINFLADHIHLNCSTAAQLQDIVYVSILV